MILVAFVVLILSIPVGYLLAWLCRDELVQGKKFFEVIMAVFALIAVIILLFGNYVITLTAVFILICALISLVKGYDKKWVKKRI